MMSENALTERDFRGSLVEACRSESDDVGVGWGQRAKSNWRLPLRFAGQENKVRPDKRAKSFTEVSGRGFLGSLPTCLLPW
jgi:hypothetical protein